jgi:hypothetical protein
MATVFQFSAMLSTAGSSVYGHIDAATGITLDAGSAVGFNRRWV